MMCKAVQIVPQNKDYNYLYGQALTLKAGGYIELKTLQQNENKSLTLIIN
jgi:cytochrome c-type biogenesis protein CcmH/NrfG